MSIVPAVVSYAYDVIYIDRIRSIGPFRIYCGIPGVLSAFSRAVEKALSYKIV